MEGFVSQMVYHSLRYVRLYDMTLRRQMPCSEVTTGAHWSQLTPRLHTISSDPLLCKQAFTHSSKYPPPNTHTPHQYLPQIHTHSQNGPLFFHVWALPTPGTWLLAAMILYCCRVLEKRESSTKFLVRGLM